MWNVLKLDLDQNRKLEAIAHLRMAGVSAAIENLKLDNLYYYMTKY